MRFLKLGKFGDLRDWALFIGANSGWALFWMLGNFEAAVIVLLNCIVIAVWPKPTFVLEVKNEEDQREAV